MFVKAAMPALALGALLLSAVGCSGSAPITPTEAGSAGLPPEAANFLPVAELTSNANQTVALYHLEIEPGTLNVTVEPVNPRQGQVSPQAKHYDMELWGAVNDPQGNPFLTIRGADQFKVTSVTDLPGVGMLVNFTHKHPLSAPNYTVSAANFYTDCADCLCYDNVRPSPIRPSKREECLRAQQFGGVRPTAINRSDLSYAGRAVFLGNVAGDTQTYFGSATVDTKAVVNADGYIDPRTVINAASDTRHPGLTNTLFPYVLLADDAKNNRSGVSNGGVMTGNYDPAQGGWQRFNLGTNRNGWTGYDLIHAGQTVSNSVILKAVPAGGYSGYVALVIKYTDPRGAASLFWRWPTPTHDAKQFSYRLPFAAMDASVIVPPTQPTEIEGAAGSTAMVSVKVRDWDRTAVEHTSWELYNLNDVSKVQDNASGNCTVSLSVPFLSATPVTLAYSSGSGLPNAESVYQGTVTNSLGTAAPGDYIGLVRVTDPESTDTDAGNYRFGIDNPPTYTNASPALALPLVTYQLVPFTVKVGVPAVSGVSPSGCPEPITGSPGASIQFSASATNAPTGWSWNFGGGATPNTSTQQFPVVTLGAEGTYTGTVTATNSAGASTPFEFCFVVAQEPPTVRGVNPVCPQPAGTSGQSGVVFLALVIGQADSFTWDFGGGATINGGGSSAMPSVTLGATGTYTGIVNASNASGSGEPLVFCFEVQ